MTFLNLSHHGLYVGLAYGLTLIALTGYGMICWHRHRKVHKNA